MYKKCFSICQGSHYLINKNELLQVSITNILFEIQRKNTFEKRLSNINMKQIRFFQTCYNSFVCNISAI